MVWAMQFIPYLTRVPRYLKKFVEQLAEEKGRQKDYHLYEMVERLAKATVGSDIWKEYDRGVLSEEEILNRFIANDPELEEDLRKTLANVHGIMERYDYAIPWIEELKAKGYQFLVLSNFSRKVLRECWSELDFLPYVDGGILSCQDKLIKPMPEIYSLILSRYHLKPEECVFMDDIWKIVEAARRAGSMPLYLKIRNRQSRCFGRLE